MPEHRRNSENMRYCSQNTIKLDKLTHLKVINLYHSCPWWSVALTVTGLVALTVTGLIALTVTGPCQIRVELISPFRCMFSSARKSQRANPKRERSGRSGVFLAIKTAQDEVSHEFDTWHTKILTIYGDLDWGEPGQGRGSEIEPKRLILSPISNSV